jgi:hypothetical protein
MSRFKGKPVGGLPSKLPPGEQILWQGAPLWRSLARHAFRIRLIAGYFALLILWRVAGPLMAGHTALYAATSGLSGLTLAAAGIGLFSFFAWLIARTTTYTITNHRVVITYGMALPKSINLPYVRIDAADMRLNAEGTGDIALTLPEKTRLSYILLWPHVRAGVKGRAEPVLRCIAAPEATAEILAGALAGTIAAGERAVTAQAETVDNHVMTAQAA